MNPIYPLDAERSIIGAVIRRPDALARVELQDDDFYHPEHRRIWGAALQAQAEQKPLDEFLVSAGSGVSLDLVTDLSAAAGTAENIEHYAEIVRDASARRRLVLIAERIQTAARAGDTADDIISQGLRDLRGAYHAPDKFVHIGDVGREWYEAAKFRAENPDAAPPLGVPTGISVLNGQLAYNGLPRGHLTVIGAESSGGKSALLDNGFIFPAARMGHSCCLCSFEDSARSVFVRGLASLACLTNKRLQNEQVEPNDWQHVHMCTRQLCDLPIYILDVVPSGVDQMVRQIERHLDEHPTDLLGIDYLQFVRAGVRTESKTAASEYVITAIATLARRLQNTATVLLSQYRKLQDGKRPGDDDLRDANAVRYFAHTIIHIWRPEKAKNMGCKTLAVTKNKNGPIGDLVVGWIPKTVTFCDPDPGDEREYRLAIGENA